MADTATATAAEARAVTAQLDSKPKPKPSENLTGPQKAAAVIVALGAEKASQLYKYMEPEDVEQLTIEVAKLGFLDSELTEDVLNDYYKMCISNKAVTEGGLEYARAVLEKAYGPQTAEELLGKVTKTLKNRQFSFMDKADVKSMFSALQNERAQTIALVLAHVDADKAAGVVAQLDGPRQVQVVESMAKLDSVSPAAVKIVEAEMRNKFSNIVTSTNVKVGGIDYVADVMNSLDRSSEKNIFDGIATYDQELADEIRKRMFVFEDIITMDDRSVQRFVRPQRSGVGPQSRQRRGFQQAAYQYVFPYGPEYPGRFGDYDQRPYEGRGRRPAAHCGYHPRSGGKQRDHHPEGRKGRYHCLIFSSTLWRPRPCPITCRTP